MDALTAIGEPTRKAIVELLAEHGQLPASTMYEAFPVSAAAISQHLKTLREADVVSVEKNGQQRLYSLNSQTMSELSDWVRALTQQWEDRFSRLDDVLKEEMSKSASTNKDLNEDHYYGRTW